MSTDPKTIAIAMYKTKKVSPVEYFGALWWDVLPDAKLAGNAVLNIKYLYCHHEVGVTAPDSSDDAIKSIRLSKLNDRAPP
jgi:hypothetical protein